MKQKELHRSRKQNIKNVLTFKRWIRTYPVGNVIQTINNCAIVIV